MKIKNIVFSGVMGAILATAANAAPTIASKPYVDGLIDNNVTNLSQTIEANYNELSKDIGLNATAIAGVDAAYQAADTRIRTDFAAADAATLADAKAYTDTEIDTLEKNLSSTGGSVEALELRVKANENNIATHTTDIATNASGVAVNKAAIDAINNADTGLLSQAKAYTDELADGAVATNTGNITTLMANAETTGSVDNKVATSAAQTKTAYETYAIPKPDSNQCNAASGLCVLSYNSQGVLQWVDVTEEGTATPDESTTGGQEA